MTALSKADGARHHGEQSCAWNPTWYGHPNGNLYANENRSAGIQTESSRASLIARKIAAVPTNDRNLPGADHPGSRPLLARPNHYAQQLCPDDAVRNPDLTFGSTEIVLPHQSALTP